MQGEEQQTLQDERLTQLAITLSQISESLETAARNSSPFGLVNECHNQAARLDRIAKGIQSR